MNDGYLLNSTSTYLFSEINDVKTSFAIRRLLIGTYPTSFASWRSFLYSIHECFAFSDLSSSNSISTYLGFGVSPCFCFGCFRFTLSNRSSRRSFLIPSFGATSFAAFPFFADSFSSFAFCSSAIILSSCLIERFCFDFDFDDIVVDIVIIYKHIYLSFIFFNHL